ncbi:hypothetical protein OIU76_010302 [Salix suchowensis]|nr:hypothetical protein OIU76_010302 [Salix suchowensis]
MPIQSSGGYQASTSIKSNDHLDGVIFPPSFGLMRGLTDLGLQYYNTISFKAPDVSIGSSYKLFKKLIRVLCNDAPQEMSPDEKSTHLCKGLGPVHLGQDPSNRPISSLFEGRVFMSISGKSYAGP